MGAYVNPPGVEKEAWLAVYADLVPDAPDSVSEREGELPVCLVDNGPFTAAGIAYDDRELSVFCDSRDARPKRWYWAPVDDLLAVSSELSRYLSMT